jgi:teichoic acid transport system permease protein
MPPNVSKASASADLAAEHGLKPVGLRPSFGAYLKGIWQRRSFITAFAWAKVESANTESRLGQFWQIINPLFSAAIYYFIFGVLLQTSRGIENFVAYLVVGVFLFTLIQRSIASGASSIRGNLGLVRALHFPRAILPISGVVEQLIAFLASLLIMFPVLLLTGEPVTWSWLLFPVAVLLVVIFCTGASLLFARLAAGAKDVTQFLPFGLRAWMYTSGVFYSVDRFTQGLPEWVTTVLNLNPGAVFLQITRDSLLASYQAPPVAWAWAAGWAFASLILGFLVFWSDEAAYGRG